VTVRVIFGLATATKAAPAGSRIVPWTYTDEATGEERSVEGVVDPHGVLHCSPWLWEALMSHSAGIAPEVVAVDWGDGDHRAPTREEQAMGAMRR
jgi:hypothetical protein